MSASENKVLELKKHVAIIHSSNKLTLLQRKIANALLFNAYKELLEKDEHVIHIVKLCELIGYASNDHKTIKKSLINLISTVLEWNLVDGERLDKEGIWNASSIIAGASIDGAICTYSYSSQMRKLLYRPNIYGCLDMQVQSKFKSTYGLALYENCNRFQHIGQTPWFDLTNFRKLMGVEDGKYKIFRDFKTRVLNKAIEEVNKYSPLFITPQVRRENRQVISIQFLIKKSSIFLINQLKLNNDLTDVLQSEFGLSLRQVSNVTNKYEELYIKEKITLIKSSLNFKSGKIKNLSRYLLSALRDDYQPAKSNTQAIQEIKQKSMKKKELNNIEKLTKYRRYQENKLFELFNALPKRNRSNLLKKFEKFLTGMYFVVYLRDGLKNVLIQEQLCEFLKKTNHILVSKIVDYSTWAKEFNS
jgi:plasmid replication initiation protein